MLVNHQFHCDDGQRCARSGRQRCASATGISRHQQQVGTAVSFDVMQPLQAFDAGGRARTVTAMVQALALAKEAGVDADQALKLVNWEE
jgi:hypothetical protein